MSLPHRRVLLAASVLALACLTACAVPSSAPTVEPEEEAPRDGLDGSLELLEELPRLEGDAFEIRYGDVDEIAAANRVPRPATGDAESLIAWAMSGERDGVPIMLPEHLAPQMLALHSEFQDELGFGLWDVSGYASVEAPPHRFTALEGEFDEAALTEAMGASEDGIWSLGGEDFDVDVTDTTAARRLGESLRIAHPDEERLLMSASTPPLRDALDGEHGLLDDESVAAVAGVLAERETISGLIVRLDFAGAGSSSGRALPAPFDTVAIGYGDTPRVATLLYAHVSPEDAEANAAALEDLLSKGSDLRGDAFSKRLSLEGSEIDGTTLVAEIAIAEDSPSTILQQMLMQREPLFAHAG